MLLAARPLASARLGRLGGIIKTCTQNIHEIITDIMKTVKI